LGRTCLKNAHGMWDVVGGKIDNWGGFVFGGGGGGGCLGGWGGGGGGMGGGGGGGGWVVVVGVYLVDSVRQKERGHRPEHRISRAQGKERTLVA